MTSGGNSSTVSFQWLKTSPECKAFEKAVKTEGVSRGAWIKKAIREKLERDGYLSVNLTRGKIVK